MLPGPPVPMDLGPGSDTSAARSDLGCGRIHREAGADARTPIQRGRGEGEDLPPIRDKPCVMSKAGIAVIIAGLLSCAGPRALPTSVGAEPPRLANLRRAAQYPWTDDGACVVRESSGDWKTLIERCYPALDHSRLRFRDVDHRCLVAQVDAATVEEVVAVCILVQPELAAVAVIVIGAVIVASAIAAEIAKEQAVARVPVATKPCQCTCLGRPDPGWNPNDPEHGDPLGGVQPHPAECRSLCIIRGFKASQCL